ncbi:MAG: D-aminoacyl-tRNA deacylase [Planctomycetes bacterium]|jgi:D-tyrosyl-tRNA(Tyr) deacylase|nr:D-aminoacyl-tRNA deacylase [Planctomycetota bacterium]
MRAVVQRVKEASVLANGRVIGAIGRGLLVLVAVHEADDEAAIFKLGEKIMNLRIFSDPQGKMNWSVKEVGGAVLVVSQFTLYGDTKKGNRPSFTDSARPEKAEPFYQALVAYLEKQGLQVATGEFGAMMEVRLANDGPVTIILDYQ